MDSNYKLVTDDYPLTFIFIGRSGCGKGTQAKLLIEELKRRDKRENFYLSTGQTFRELGQGDSYTAKLSKEAYDTGGLQPEFLAVWAWSHLLVENLRGDEHLIIDGMPRKIREAHIFDSAISFYKREKPFVIYINVSSAWAEEKLLGRGRGDDNKDDIRVRMSWFERDVLPVLDFFKSDEKYKFIEINGEQPVEKAFSDIVSKTIDTK